MKPTQEKGKKGYMLLALITKGGEVADMVELKPKVNMNKRHSKNNTVIGFRLYKNELYYTTTIYEK